MGPEQEKAASYYLSGEDGALSFHDFPVQAKVSTYSANSSVTDSAASGTAIATGQKVNNGVISVKIPGDGSELETILEHFQKQGKAVGLVTTAFITHATPAAFAAHTSSRGNYAEIGEDYFTETLPNVLFGGGGNGVSPDMAEAAGYLVVTDAEELAALDPEAPDPAALGSAVLGRTAAGPAAQNRGGADNSSAGFVSGQFGSTHLPYELDGLGELPHLHEMAAAALKVLSKDPDGFFLMIEGARIDHACHANDIERAVDETAEFAKTVETVEAWIAAETSGMVHLSAENILLIVTADHETGGLTVTNSGAGSYPAPAWTTDYHTGAEVNVYASGCRAEDFAGITDNTEIHDVLASF